MGRIVILGGGYAGLHAFAAMRGRLGRQIASGEVELTLVSRDPYHTYHGWTGEVLSGRLPVERTLTPIAPLLRSHFLQGNVNSVDLAGRTVEVTTADGDTQTLAFDHLMFGTGSRDPFDRLAGLAEHGWCVKNTRDMQSLVSHLDTLDDQPQVPRNVVVIGGGFAGVETASALALRFREKGNQQVTVHLVSSGTQLLDGLRPDFARIADHATSVLYGQGVQVHQGLRVESIARDRVEFSDGGSLSSDLTVATAGLAFDNLPGTDALPKSEAGRLTVDRSLQVTGQHGIWAAGDIAAVRHPSTGEPCPANALWAMKQGDCVGRNIARAIRGKEPRRFGFKGMGQAAGLIGTGGITELYGLQFTGKFAWLVRILFFAWYMPSRPMGFSIARDLFTQWVASATGPLLGASYKAFERIPKLARARLSLRRLPRS
ncbi:MAG TPA: FAD-dependent oxidoreductase [Arsenicitalea sp.]|jgi:NADH dehydrogenase|nr:FAD-dependent oxidoreductase [Arsenicitalea sp.]